MNKYFLTYILGALLSLGAASCSQSGGHLVDGLGGKAGNGIYMQNRNASGTISTLLTPDAGASFFVQPRIASITDRDVKVRVLLDGEALEAYNRANNLSLLPINAADIVLTDEDGQQSTDGTLTTVIPAGSVIANIAGQVKPLDEAKYPADKRYAIAIRVVPVEGEELQVLSAPTTTIISFDRQIVTDVVEILDLLGGGRTAKKGGIEIAITKPLEKEVSEWTFQMHCYFTALGRNDIMVASPNQTMANFFGPGTKGEWYTRISEDLGMQFKAGRDGLDTWTQKPLKPNRWMQITFVHKASGLSGTTSFYINGELQKTWYNTPAYRFETGDVHQGFSIAGSRNWRDGDKLREVKLWDRALSPAEIMDKVYLPENPEAEGLLFYVPFSAETWDAEKGTFAELTGKGTVELNGGAPVEMGKNIRFLQRVVFPADELVIKNSAEQDNAVDARP